MLKNKFVSFDDFEVCIDCLQSLNWPATDQFYSKNYLAFLELLLELLFEKVTHYYGFNR